MQKILWSLSNIFTEKEFCDVAVAENSTLKTLLQLFEIIEETESLSSQNCLFLELSHVIFNLLDTCDVKLVTTILNTDELTVESLIMRNLKLLERDLLKETLARQLKILDVILTN